MCKNILWVMISINLLVSILVFTRSCYAWRVVPAHQTSYVLRDQREKFYEEDIHPDDYEYYEMNLPKNSLHTIYKFGWCKHDVVQSANLVKSSNYTVPHRFAAATQWIYILDRANLRQFSLQCVVVKVFVPAKYQFKRTRIPFNYCQGSIIYLMMNTVGKILIHEFYFKAPFNMPATFVFEYYQPIML